MNCTKPSSPYLFILVITFGISLVSIPKNVSKETIDQQAQHIGNDFNEEKVHIEVAELNIEDYE